MNRAKLAQIQPEETIVKLEKREEEIEVEADKMWSFVQSKKQQRWLWHAIDHQTGEVLAYVLGTYEDESLLKLKALLEPFGIKQFYTDAWSAYQRYIDPNEHTVGKRNTQTIWFLPRAATSERKHLTLRTKIERLARKTICFSKSIEMHDIVIGLFINRFEFGCVF